MKNGFYIFVIFFSLTCYSQEKKNKLPTYFGIQVRPVLPSNFNGDNLTLLSGDVFETSISQRLGFGFGGIIRTSITKLIALETGLNYTQRNFNITAAIPDSTVYAKDSLTFIEYDIPLNVLIYIQLSKKTFMNVSLGGMITYKPTNTWTQNQPKGKHYFDLYGDRYRRIGFDLNANIGFEYRTKKSGFFYLGGSIRVPTAPLLRYSAYYQYGANTTVNHSLNEDIDGSFLTFDFKYFFPLIKNRGEQFLKGPIE